MKLGEIKIEALKLMFASYEVDFSETQLRNEMADDTYRDYLMNMPGAINRAFSVIENKCVLPIKSYTFDSKELDLAKLSDFSRVYRVVFNGKGGCNVPDFLYKIENKKLLMTDELREGESYTLYYRPKLTRITSGTDDDTELDIPDNIAVFIPYFIKGELYREEEPGEATEAHNLFMKALDELTPENVGHGSVTTVFGMGW